MAVFALDAKAERATWAEIDLAGLRTNARLLKERAHTRLMAVVKANAYGHGAGGIAETLSSAGADFFGVAAPYEGALLRAAGVTKPIVVLSPALAAQANIIIRNRLTPAVSDFATAEAFHYSGIRYHVKVNTGMNRSGSSPEATGRLIEQIMNAHGNKSVEGVFSHLHSADSIDRSSAYDQFAVFERLLTDLRKRNIRPEIAHIANSATVLDMPEMALDLVRPGIALYGCYPSRYVSHHFPLKPVLTWYSTVAEVRRLKKGDHVSYGDAYTAEKETTVALLPVGYADGYRRSLGGKAHVIIGGHRCPVAGTICMDLTVVECGDHPVQPGEKAVLLGRQESEKISADDLAAWLGTINYEITTQITDRVPRTFIDKEQTPISNARREASEGLER